MGDFPFEHHDNLFNLVLKMDYKMDNSEIYTGFMHF